MLEQMVGNEAWKNYEYAAKALDKHIPKKIVHIHEEYPKHDWIRDKNGEIDMWVMDVGFHNGPGCKRCGVTVCECCNPDYDQDKCVVDEMHCPSCNACISWPYEKIRHCPGCGQALDWSE